MNDLVDEEEDLPPLDIAEPRMPEVTITRDPPDAPPAPPSSAAAPLSRETLDRAFSAKPKREFDWKALADSIQAAGQSGRVNNTLERGFQNTSMGGSYHPDLDSGQELQTAEAPLKLEQAQAGEERAAAADSRAGEELHRRSKADELRAQLARAGMLSKDEQAKMKAKADSDKAQMEAEGRAVDDDRAEQTLQETVRHNLASEGNAGKAIDARKKPKGGPAAPMPKAGALESVPEDMRETVRAIGEGRAKAPEPGTRFGAKILSMVNAVYPDFDATRFGAYKHVVEKQATGKDKLAVDVARKHLAEAKSMLPDNFDTRSLNRVRKAFLENSGGEELSGFEAAALVAAHEVASVYGIEDQTGKQLIEHLLDPNQSVPQLRARFDTIDKLIRGKQEGLEDQAAAYAPKSKASAPTGKVVVRKGNERLEIDAGDVKAAQVDGYEVVK